MLTTPKIFFVKNCISKYFLKTYQINELIIVLSLMQVAVIKVTETEATVIHSIDVERTDRVAIFPGFDIESFPFIMYQRKEWDRHHYFKGALADKEWYSCHIKIRTQRSELKGLTARNVQP